MIRSISNRLEINLLLPLSKNRKFLKHQEIQAELLYLQDYKLVQIHIFSKALKETHHQEFRIEIHLKHKTY